MLGQAGTYGRLAVKAGTQGRHAGRQPTTRQDRHSWQGGPGSLENNAGRHSKAERQVWKAAEAEGQMSSWVGVQARLVGQMGKAGGSAGKVDKARQLGGKAGRTRKKATGGRERHDLCSQGWTSTAGT